jgi:hypothetical protein
VGQWNSKTFEQWDRRKNEEARPWNKKEVGKMGNGVWDNA